MAVRPYDDTSAGYGDETTGSGVAGKTFLWLAWALAAAFWAASLTIGAGIMRSLGASTDGPAPSEIDAGGLSWLTIEVVGGMLILGAALAYGLYRYATRDKRRDPQTEAATHALYDMVEAAGGDDEVTRSPDAREPDDRDAARVARGELRP